MSIVLIYDIHVQETGVHPATESFSCCESDVRRLLIHALLVHPRVAGEDFCRHMWDGNAASFRALLDSIAEKESSGCYRLKDGVMCCGLRPTCPTTSNRRDSSTQTDTRAAINFDEELADRIATRVNKSLHSLVVSTAAATAAAAAKEPPRQRREPVPPAAVPAAAPVTRYVSSADRFRQLAYCDYKGQGAVGFVYTAVAVDGTFCAVKQANKDEGSVAFGISDLLRMEALFLRDCIGLPHVAQLLHAEFDGFNRCTRLIFPRYHSIEWGALLKVLLRCSVRDAFRNVQQYLKSLFGALAGIHSRCIIHGDVKPDNFLYNFSIDPPQADLTVPVRVVHEPRPGTGVLIDFTHAARLPTVSGLRGTSCWRAPELAARSVSAATATAVDMWSAGLLCASLLMTESIQSLDVENYTSAKRGGLSHEFALCHKLSSNEFLATALNKSWMLGAAKDKRAAPAALNLVTGLLQFDPGRRMTAVEALVHEFFSVTL